MRSVALSITGTRRDGSEASVRLSSVSRSNFSRNPAWPELLQHNPFKITAIDVARGVPIFSAGGVRGVGQPSMSTRCRSVPRQGIPGRTRAWLFLIRKLHEQSRGRSSEGAIV